MDLPKKTKDIRIESVNKKVIEMMMDMDMESVLDR